MAEEEVSEPVGLKAFQPKDLGLYAPFEISPEPMFTEDELGEDLVTAIRTMAVECGKFEDAARIWELMQASEARLFDRGYQWLTPAAQGQGWNLAGTKNSTGSGAIAVQDKGRMWALNIYGARKDKIVSALTVKDPEPEFFPKRPENALDQQAAEESGRFKEIWKQTNNIRGLCNKACGLFYTDDRVTMITETVADAQRFDMDGKEAGVGELTRAYGKLEVRVPMSVDEDEPLPWLMRSRELDLAVAKEKFYWLSNLNGGSGVDGSIARTCRLTVRNAVSGQIGLTGNAVDRAVTETTIWVRPSQYRDIIDDDQRKNLRDNFPRGMRIVYAGEKFAYCRNESMNDVAVIMYSREGTGQNRRAIGTNNLTTQKVLNYDYSLFQRYMIACVPRKLHRADKFNSEAINQQESDPLKSTPMTVDAGEDMNTFTATETVPQPPAQLMDFITAHLEDIPTTMDGASPSMWGIGDSSDESGVAITIKRDQALQVFGTPFNALNWGIAKSCQNGAKWAGRNSRGTISGMVPNAGRVSVDTDKLNGDTYCFPQADSGYPESEAEKEQKLTNAIDSSSSLPSLAAALNDPCNFVAIETVTKRFNIKIKGSDSVRKQQEEFEHILVEKPQPNPALAQAQQQAQQVLQQAQHEPDAQTPQGQQAMQQIVQQVAQIPPTVCSVAVEQDASVNHGIEASICFDKINSPEGQKLKREMPLMFQNLMLHWQGHVDMAQKLSPPPAPPEVRPSVTVAVDKLGPEAQAMMLQQEYGLNVTPEQAAPPEPETDIHEIIQKKTGVDANGVPVEQTQSYSGKPLT